MNELSTRLSYKSFVLFNSKLFSLRPFIKEVEDVAKLLRRMILKFNYFFILV